MTHHEQTDKELHAIFRQNEEAEWIDLIHTPGEKYRIRIKGEDTNGTYSLIEVMMDPKDEPPYGPMLHIHQRTDEIFRILEGQVRFRVDGEEFDAGVGDIVNIPKGTPHAFANFGDSRLHVQIMFIPGGEEAFWQTINGMPLDEMEKVCKTFHVDIVGPPLHK
ncbi:cupin domain-containing protein [Paenibacillus sp. CF384]|uniref:cupin domain-containing protein n=1 Tax=Paenibacillus sp. CF384 TaxID=1884382 RepID=UPI0008972AEE|nr:cupin domain-containing protein [Paenibacillus sp. CF384]SDX71336.1 Mannose-6-phosphate isomerase, cupin superfamily [Paenibacillus sp. CF384]